MAASETDSTDILIVFKPLQQEQPKFYGRLENVKQLDWIKLYQNAHPHLEITDWFVIRLSLSITKSYSESRSVGNLITIIQKECRQIAQMDASRCRINDDTKSAEGLVVSIRELINGFGERKKNFILHDNVYVMAILIDANLDPTGKMKEEVWDACIHNDEPNVERTTGSVMRNHTHSYPQQIRLANILRNRYAVMLKRWSGVEKQKVFKQFSRCEFRVLTSGSRLDKYKQRLSDPDFSRHFYEIFDTEEFLNNYFSLIRCGSRNRMEHILKKIRDEASANTDTLFLVVADDSNNSFIPCLFCSNSEYTRQFSDVPNVLILVTNSRPWCNQPTITGDIEFGKGKPLHSVKWTEVHEDDYKKGMVITLRALTFETQNNINPWLTVNVKNNLAVNPWTGVNKEASASSYLLKECGDGIQISTVGLTEGIMKLVVCIRKNQHQLRFVPKGTESSVGNIDIVCDKFKICHNHGVDIIEIETCMEPPLLLAYDHGKMVLSENIEIAKRNAAYLFFIDSVREVDEPVDRRLQNYKNGQYLSRNFYFQTNGNHPENVLMVLDESFPVKLKKQFPHEYVLCSEYIYYLLLIDLMRKYTVPQRLADLFDDPTKTDWYQYIVARSRRIEAMREKLHLFSPDMIQVRHPILYSVWDLYVEQAETHAWRGLLASAEKCKKSGVVGTTATITFFRKLSTFLFHVNMETYETKLQEIKLKLDEFLPELDSYLATSPTKFDGIHESVKNEQIRQIYTLDIVSDLTETKSDFLGNVKVIKSSKTLYGNCMYESLVMARQILLGDNGTFPFEVARNFGMVRRNPSLAQRGCIVISNDEDDSSESVSSNITTLDLRAIEKVEEEASSKMMDEITRLCRYATKSDKSKLPKIIKNKSGAYKIEKSAPYFVNPRGTPPGDLDLKEDLTANIIIFRTEPHIGNTGVLLSTIQLLRKSVQKSQTRPVVSSTSTSTADLLRNEFGGRGAECVAADTEDNLMNYDPFGTPTIQDNQEISQNVHEDNWNNAGSLEIPSSSSQFEELDELEDYSAVIKQGISELCSPSPSTDEQESRQTHQQNTDKDSSQVTVQAAPFNLAADYPNSQLQTSGIEAPQKEITSTRAVQSTSDDKHNNENGVVSGSESHFTGGIMHTSYPVKPEIETARVSTPGSVETEDLNTGGVARANQETEIVSDIICLSDSDEDQKPDVKPLIPNPSVISSGEINNKRKRSSTSDLPPPSDAPDRNKDPNTRAKKERLDVIPLLYEWESDVVLEVRRGSQIPNEMIVDRVVAWMKTVCLPKRLEFIQLIGTGRYSRLSYTDFKSTMDSHPSLKEALSRIVAIKDGQHHLVTFTTGGTNSNIRENSPDKLLTEVVSYFFHTKGIGGFEKHVILLPVALCLQMELRSVEQVKDKLLFNIFGKNATMKLYFSHNIREFNVPFMVLYVVGSSEYI